MVSESAKHDLSRRTVIVGGMGVAAIAAGLGVGVGRLTAPTASAATDVAAKTPGTRTFVSTSLTTPEVISSKSGATERGLLFIGQQSSTGFNGSIIDDSGEPAWIEPTKANITDLRPGTFEGKPVLTYWTGAIISGHGEGRGVILDQSYTRIAEVNAGEGLESDLHEFNLTATGTALVIAYVTEKADLSSLGGPTSGYMYNCHVQEVDVRTGAVLLDWSARDHVPLNETYMTLTQDPAHDGTTAERAFDAYHVNAVSESGDRRLLISARHTHTIYSVDRKTGQVMWRFGGKRSDIAVQNDAVFAWQHDVRRDSSGAITLFDNHEYSTTAGSISRGMKFSVNETTMRATFLQEYAFGGQLATAMGSVQILDNGNVLVGWGTVPAVDEFTASGRSVYRAALGGISYRAARGIWVGKPTTDPDVGFTRQPDGSLRVYASWNGATGVHSWRVLTGETGTALKAGPVAQRAGFETSIPVASAGIVAMQALDASGKVLGTSKSMITNLSSLGS